MRRPVTVVLLFMFAAIQLYFARVPLAHQVQGSTWIDVSRAAGGLAYRQGRYYLVSPQDSYQLSANSVHITTERHPINWVDVPEPSGQGIWHLALGPQRIPLAGIGGPVYPSPNGQSVLWLDPATHLAYTSTPPEGSLVPISNRLTHVSRVLWAPDSQALALTAQGPGGYGVYVWDHDHNIVLAAIPARGQTVTGLGFTRSETVMVALSNGEVISQGKGTLKLPKLSPVQLANGQAALLGMTPRHVVFWDQGMKKVFARAGLKWIGRPHFSVNGRYAAVLARATGGQSHLLLYGQKNQLSVSLPYHNQSSYHLIGFVGSHWVLVTIPTGPHHGTYAWWVSMH